MLVKFQLTLQSAQRNSGVICDYKGSRMSGRIKGQRPNHDTVLYAGVVELVDTGDLKSPGGDTVRVRVPSPAPDMRPWWNRQTRQLEGLVPARECEFESRRAHH